MHLCGQLLAGEDFLERGLVGYVVVLGLGPVMLGSDRRSELGSLGAYASRGHHVRHPRHNTFATVRMTSMAHGSCRSRMTAGSTRCSVHGAAGQPAGPSGPVRWARST